jgi:hypothetical protein
MAVLSSTSSRLFGAVLSCMVLLGLATGASAGSRTSGASLSVTGVHLLPDGRMEVRAVVTCPFPTPYSFTGYDVGVRQRDRSGNVYVERAPCSGSRQRWSVVVAPSEGAFIDGPIGLSFLLRTDCATTSGEVVCGGLLQYHTDAPRALTGTLPAATPVLNVRRLRLRPDGQVDLRSSVRCDRGSADDFSVLLVGLGQSPTADGGEEVQRFPCTGRPQPLRYRFISSTEVPFGTGPARLLVQLASDCRELPYDDGDGTYAWCLSVTAYERPVVLGGSS